MPQNTFCLIMVQSSRTASWTKSCNNWELIEFSLLHTTPNSNGKLEVFHKYLKSTLKKLCEKDPANWDKYLNQVLTSYRITPNLATAESPFFLVYGRDPNLPLHQLLEPMQHFLGDPDFGKLNLETHRLVTSHCQEDTGRKQIHSYSKDS